MTDKDQNQVMLNRLNVSIGKMLFKRYKDLVNMTGLKKLDKEMQFRTLMLIEHNRQMIEGWKKSLKTKKKWDAKTFKNIKKINPEA